MTAPSPATITDATPEHTPTPWRVEQGTGLVWGNCTVFEDGTPDRLGVPVPVADGQLERPWGKGSGPTYDEMEANAAFIVKAVNNHDALIDALQEAREFIDAQVDVIDGPEGQPRPNRAMQLARQINEALGKAGVA